MKKGTLKNLHSQVSVPGPSGPSCFFIVIPTFYKLVITKTKRLRVFDLIKRMKEVALRKQNLHGKIAAEVLLKLFISENEDATPLTPLAHKRNSILICKQHTSMIPEDQKNITTH